MVFLLIPLITDSEYLFGGDLRCLLINSADAWILVFLPTMDDAAVRQILTGRGGVHQQALFRVRGDHCGSDSDDPESDRCRLVEVLLFLFAFGLLSGPNVQWVAEAALEAGARV